MKQPDIMIYMSDQHGADYCSWGDVKVDTAVLESMKQEGTTFMAAYTSCPLCVPARMSMMSSLLPSHNGVYNNGYTLSNLTPCFTHELAAAGYETVLIGRMHFTGRDQRHGFTKRLAPDITPVSWKKPFKKIVEERGKTISAFSAAGATDLVGAGESIVTDYDEMVLETALNYLMEDHEKPQFILVGTFGPHFPYITDEAMYHKYLDRVKKPEFFEMNSLPDYVKEMDILKGKVKPENVDWEIARGCLAAYCGQIEVMDHQIGALREAWKNYGQKKGNGSVFGYISDHGDMAGERRMYGKQTYFEKSVKVPMIFEGTGIAKNRVVNNPVSLMDVGPTICAIAGTSFEIGDGVSLKNYMSINMAPDFVTSESQERIVVSQMIDGKGEDLCASVMLRYGNYKYMLYHNRKPVMFDLKKDSGERYNIINDNPKMAEWFLRKAKKYADFDFMEKQCLEHKRNAEWFKAYDNAAGFDDSERWQDNPPTSKGDNLSIIVVDRIKNVECGW